MDRLGMTGKRTEDCKKMRMRILTEKRLRMGTETQPRALSQIILIANTLSRNTGARVLLQLNIIIVATKKK